ncbi:serine/threonine-protein kinase Chk1-like [Oppia nitens]|uniref:serine/threonine-protein kinase Chk1-like n=1 Tax=Oppia nitens TaxID=1686743 RepID=UPI0023DAEE59|nr:serine/threonine-protein kinase Chk1-like [Oppia nitens]
MMTMMTESSPMSTEFVKGWILSTPLGEGHFGQVWLLVNNETDECVAAKVIDLSKHPEAKTSLTKEICFHKKLNHENIIKFIGHRTDETIEYIFLEYASGGELFDRIEPDIGMDTSLAHRFFAQIIAGVEYLHSKGIVHRDLKPENILLDENDNIKICDFEMSTLFLYSGVERLVNSTSGTVPYMAPEIFTQKQVKAAPIDIWSCGVILVTLLAGELPWDQPTDDCEAYRDWIDSDITSYPWNKIDSLVLSLLRKILCPNVTKRYTLTQIRNHHWFKKWSKNNENHQLDDDGDGQGYKRRRLADSDVSTAGTAVVSSVSQPSDVLMNSQLSVWMTNKDNNNKHKSFSQPTAVDNMILNTQLTPFGNSQSVYQRLVKRMTRFFTNRDSNQTFRRLKHVFDERNYTLKTPLPTQFTISTNDKRGMPLVFSANIIEMNPSNILVDFRLMKGNGIEFKRHFISIRNDINDIVVKGPITWPIACATHTLP